MNYWTPQGVVVVKSRVCAEKFIMSFVFEKWCNITQIFRYNLIKKEIIEIESRYCLFFVVGWMQFVGRYLLRLVVKFN